MFFLTHRHIGHIVFFTRIKSNFTNYTNFHYRVKKIRAIRKIRFNSCKKNYVPYVPMC
jgi:hypothetical protein